MRVSRPLGVVVAFLTLVALVALATGLSAQAGQTNPFVKTGKAHATTTVAPSLSPAVDPATVSNTEPNPFQKAVAAVIGAQRTLNQLIARLVRAVQPGGDSFDPWALATLLGLSLLYGILHALGPGHGKAIASTFFLTRDAKIRHGFELGYWLALIHAAVAIGLVLVLSLVLRVSISGGTEAFSWWLGTVSYGLVVGIGLFMLADGLVQLVTSGRRHLHFHIGAGGHAAGDHNHADHDDPDHHHAEPGSPGALVRSRELVFLGFLSAVVPCPGAVGIMVFATGAGSALVGGLAVLSLSLGMGLTASVAGIAGILARRGVLKVGGRVLPSALVNLGAGIRIVGSLAFATLGLLLLLGQF